jgi:hypothetical protein
MRTSLTDIRLTEQYLKQQMSAEDKLLFEAQMLTSPMLKLNVAMQRKAYRIVQLFHRAQLKKQTEAIHQRLFSDPDKKDFQQSILQLFKP